MFLLYDILLFLSALVLIPYYLLRGLRHGKVRHGIRERLGFFSPGRLAPLAGKKVLWVHAVSVGETRAAIPFVRALKKAYPDRAVILSNVTETGQAIAREIREVDLCLFFPFDFSWVVRRVLDRIKPELIAIVETEIWPNFVRLAQTRGIPVVLVNGRISDRSFPRYLLAQRFLQPVLARFAAFCMQSEADARRIKAMGADSEQVTVTGNLKFDMQTAVPDPAAVARIKEQFRLPTEAPVWVAGSTHAGEEQALADVYQRLLDERQELALVLVPRHPERCRAVAEMLASRGLSFVLRSAVRDLDRPLRPGEVLLVDSIGEMLKFYAVADLIFVGGSLVKVGGHNVLEASLLKKPVLFGPHMHNFKEIARLLLAAEGGLRVADGRDLLVQCRQLLLDPYRRRVMGLNGFALLECNAGATDRTLEVVRRMIG